MDPHKPTRPAKSRIKLACRWASNLCLVAGMGALVVCGFVWAQAHLFQVFAGRRLDLEVNASAVHAKAGDRLPVSLKSAQGSQPAKDDSLIGKLRIDRLGISVVVLEGVEDNTLRIAAGHVPETALPGHSGNVAIAAHRDTFFRPLRNIRDGDKITLETPTGSYLYKVESHWIVEPDDLEVLNPTPYPTLTLITCYPFYYLGNAPHRFIVRARQVTTQSVSESMPKNVVD